MLGSPSAAFERPNPAFNLRTGFYAPCFLPFLVGIKKGHFGNEPRDSLKETILGSVCNQFLSPCLNQKGLLLQVARTFRVFRKYIAKVDGYRG